MNWEVKEKYPKAFKLWLKFENYEAEPVVVDYSRDNQDIYLADSENQTTFLCYVRDLYDFFDEQGIYIVPIQIIWKNEVMWEYRIGNKKTIQEFRSQMYDTRTEAEEQAFLKAFELLEEKL
jgi:phage-related protein